MLGYALKQNQKKYIRTFKGKYFKPTYVSNQHKIKKKTIVFDLDETLGQFTDLHVVYKTVVKLLHRDLSQSEFNSLMDLYPEFLRPGIITILEFLYHKKTQNAFYRLFLYTNNQCSGNWIKYIIYYLHLRIGALENPLFEEPICAFKIRDKVVELRRTSNVKSYSDLIQCIMLPSEKTEICFIDNTYYEKMCNDSVYYILPQSYYHSLKKNDIINRLIKNINIFTSSIGSVALYNLLEISLCENEYDKTSRETDIYITKKIMFHVREFLYFGSDDAIYRIKHSGKTARRSRGFKISSKTRKNMELL
jgi:hypothetical protein